MAKSKKKIVKKKTAKKVLKKTTKKKVAKKTTSKAAKKAVKKLMKKKVAKKAAKKVVKKPTKKKLSKKVAKKKSAKKTTSKAAPKVVKKKVVKKSTKKSASKTPQKSTKKKLTKEAAPKAVKKKSPKKLSDSSEAKSPKNSKGFMSQIVDKMKKVAAKPAKAQNEKPLEPAITPKKKSKAPVAKAPQEVETLIEEFEMLEFEPLDVVLTDAEGNRYCRVSDCDQISKTEAYCRYHYLLFWKKVQLRKKILEDDKLEQYIIELIARFPDKQLEILRKDLRSEKDFISIIHELELDEDTQYEGTGEGDDEVQRYNEEVRGMVDTRASKDEEEY